MGLKDLFAAHDGSATAPVSEISVEGMHCNACERLVSDALEGLGAKDVTADHESGRVTYSGELDAGQVADAIAKAGFKVV
jgi:copper chaperone CopZ